jgi:flagellin-specific chaperone FliS
VRDLKGASELFALKGDPRSQADAIHLIVHAQQVITELNRALDTRDGGDLIANLGRIYEYMQHRLTDAVKNRDVNIVDEILGLLTELLDTWASMARRSSEKLNKEPHDPAGDLRRDEEEGEQLGDTSDGGY